MSEIKSKNIELVDFSEALGERYLSYALSTIMSRSLPDVRDGLKPVHRRLLYSMLLLKLDPASAYKKCARVVGDVMGKFHPHSDGPIYDSLVRLAQDFTVRYPLIDGQGNFGSIDGDSAAAMRYTESKLTPIAMELLKHIDKDTVDFRSTYDNQESEPEVLPAAFPNILANGSEGIAVGMATSIPPHNLSEICDALQYLIVNPDAEIENLVKFIKGPDLPTGGVIIEDKETIINAYKTGKGSLRVRAKWKIEELDMGQYQIVVYEIPYQVQKSKLIEKLADLFKNKKLPLLGNIRDESAEDIRIILEPKSRQVDSNILMESLFKTTDFENRISMNLNVLDKNSIPKVMNLKEILSEFLAFRQELVLRRAKYQLSKVENRIEILEGFLIVYLNLDDVINIIRYEDNPKDALIAKYQLSEIQVEAILNMRLRSIRKLEEIAIKKEHSSLKQEQTSLKAIITSKDHRWKLISEEIDMIKEKYGKKTAIGKRKTKIESTASISEISFEEAFIEKESITICCSKMGWLRSFKGHNYDPKGIKYKDGDKERFIINACRTDKLLIFSDNGKFFTITCDKIPSTRGDGESIKFMIDIGAAKIVDIFIYKAGVDLLLASYKGKGFIVKSDDLLAQTKNGKQIFSISKGDKAYLARDASGDMIAVIGTNRKLLIFTASELPVMKKAAGIILQKYPANQHLSDVKFFNKSDGLSWKLGSKIRTENKLTPWISKRAKSGIIPPNGFPKSNQFS